jgi:hypothetical protein
LDKLRVIATYKNAIREICPHVLGMTGGREKALFYQFGGASRSELGVIVSSKNWRGLFLVAYSWMSYPVFLPLMVTKAAPCVSVPSLSVNRQG